MHVNYVNPIKSEQIALLLTHY